MIPEELTQRQNVVMIARSWIATVYRHGGRLKQVGADCTFFGKVYEEAGLIEPLDIKPYSNQAHLHRAAGAYVTTILRFATETKVPKPGDIAMFHVGRDYSHGGVINAHGWPEVEFEKAEGWPWIIHANMAARMIFEERADQTQLMLAKATKFFTLWPGT